MWALLPLLIGGCSDNDVGVLTGEQLVVRGCDGAGDALFQPYGMDGTFFGLEALGDIAFIRMQNSGKGLLVSDAMVLEVNDSHFVRNRLGQEIPIDSPKIRATLHMLGSCPDTTQAMTANGGTITFGHYDSQAGGRVSATFNFDLLDDRTGEVVGIDFHGSFDFIVKKGQPYQPFVQVD